MIALAGKATSIRTRLYFATVFSLLLLVGVGLLGYVGLDRTRDTVAVLFKQHVQTLTDMSDLRTTLGEMRRVEKDIILNFNNAVEVASQREIWAKTLASWRTRLAAVRTLKADEASFTTAIDKTLQEVKQYEDGVSPVFAQIEAAQLDGAGGAAYADKFKGHMEASDELLASMNAPVPSILLGITKPSVPSACRSSAIDTARNDASLVRARTIESLAADGPRSAPPRHKSDAKNTATTTKRVSFELFFLVFFFRLSLMVSC